MRGVDVLFVRRRRLRSSGMPQVFVFLGSVVIVELAIDCQQCYWSRALGDLSRMRMLILTPCEHNIRRIGSLQSPNRAPVGEVVGVAVVIDDGLLRSGSNNKEALASKGSS